MTKFGRKLAFLCCNENYVDLKKSGLKSFAKISNLPWTKEDYRIAKLTCEMMGIKQEDIFTLVDANYDKIS